MVFYDKNFIISKLENLLKKTMTGLIKTGYVTIPNVIVNYYLIDHTSCYLNYLLSTLAY